MEAERSLYPLTVHSFACPVCIADAPSSTPFSSSVVTSIVDHLVSAHNVKVENPHEIADWNAYVTHYVGHVRSPRETKDGESVCISLGELEGDTSLRERLNKERLEELLKVQRKELSDDGFCRQCLFCKKTFRGRRKNLFNHMFQEHGFRCGYIGSLVFMDALLDELSRRLENLECIHCRKIFKNRMVLHQHMRKKNHFRLPSDGHEYDWFYIQNYCLPDADDDDDDDDDEDEDGKSGEKGEVDEKKKTMKGRRTGKKECGRGIEMVDGGGRESMGEWKDDEVDDDKEWEDWVEESDDEELVGSQKTVCFICGNEFSKPPQCVSHLASIHGMDLVVLAKELDRDIYGALMIINYCRKHFLDHQCIYCRAKFDDMESLKNHYEETGHCMLPDDKEYLSSTYLIPAQDSDPLLMHDFDDD